ncbi:MAG: ribonuclease D [Gemmatimonadetes bacterium]|nr:ribonuclease D [Gemmatimonadota bacterium]
MLIRAMSRPAATSARIISGDELAGPIVQTILVLSIPGSSPHHYETHKPERGSGAGVLSSGRRGSLAAFQFRRGRAPAVRMSFILIDDPAKLPDLARALASERRIALDCEAAGFHRYSDRLCLLQISTAQTNWIVDPLAFDPGEALRGPLGNPAVEVLMHGADYDLRLLDRDLDIALHGLFDTQVAAAILGESALGLAALLETHLGVKLSKKHQRADWARRPLPADMLEYAASDTIHLHELSDLLRDKLVKAGRLEWALEECRYLEQTRWEGAEAAEEDPVARVRGARDLQPREVAGLREALEWRNQIARERDKAPFRVAGDQALLEVVVTRPGTTEALAAVKGLSPALARQNGQELLDRLDRIGALPDGSLVPYPRRARSGPGRPTPDIEERAERLKEVRNRRADELKIDRGTLLPNAVLLEVARLAPQTAQELESVPGLRKWQAAALGDGLLAAMRRKAAAR